MHFKNYMKYAIDEAQKAYESGEVPVGAAIIKNGEVICSAHNLCEEKNVLCHAEVIAINRALKKLGTKYLDGCELYVTLEPCAMCTGAIINSRISRVYIGAMDDLQGCCGSKHNLLREFCGKTEVYHGICEEECANLLKSFFRQKR